MVKKEKTYKSKWHYRLFKIIFGISLILTLVAFIFGTVLLIQASINNKVIYFEPNLNPSGKSYFNSRNDPSFNETLGIHLFNEEKNAYLKMKIDKLEDEETIKLIKDRRIDKIKELGLEDTLKVLNKVIFSENILNILFYDFMFKIFIMGLVLNLGIYGFYRAFVYVKYDE